MTRKSPLARTARLTVFSILVLGLAFAASAHAAVEPAAETAPTATEVVANATTAPAVPAAVAAKTDHERPAAKHWTDPEFFGIFDGATSGFPRPGGGNCPAWTCSTDNDCGDECYVPNCPWPCGVCVWETSTPCSGSCVCR